MNWLELFPGETGMVYKGLLMNWKDEPLQAVAVKTLKGNFICLPYVLLGAEGNLTTCVEELLSPINFSSVFETIGACVPVTKTNN